MIVVACCCLLLLFVTNLFALTFCHLFCPLKKWDVNFGLLLRSSWTKFIKTGRKKKKNNNHRLFTNWKWQLHAKFQIHQWTMNDNRYNWTRHNDHWMCFCKKVNNIMIAISNQNTKISKMFYLLLSTERSLRTHTKNRRKHTKIANKYKKKRKKNTCHTTIRDMLSARMIYMDWRLKYKPSTMTFSLVKFACSFASICILLIYCLVIGNDNCFH